MLFLSTLLISIIITIAIMPYAREMAIKIQAMDKPNPRKVHKQVMPKCGGIAMAIGACVPILLWAPKTNFMNGLLLGALTIVCFGFADDLKDLKPHAKLLGQIMAALIITLVGGIKISSLGTLWLPDTLLPDVVALPLTILVIVGVTNATNLSDGLDGLAGGISLMVFLCLGFLGVQQQDWAVVMIAIALGGSILGFLRFNSYPAQLFMGDAGSQLLGFVAVVLSIQLSQQTIGISALLPLIIFGIPVLDTLNVFFRRVAQGRSPFSADRNHFHHQLINIGFFHTEAVLVIYLIQALLISFALLYPATNDWTLLSIYLLFSFTVLSIFHFFDRKKLRIRREGLAALKARLKPLKDRGNIIKFAFGYVKVAVPMLLIFNALYQPSDSGFVLALSFAFIILLVVAWLYNKKLLSQTAKIALYIFTPFLVFRSDLALNSALSPLLLSLYNGLFLLLLISVYLTMMLTRRANGFKSSTMDFLVIFVIILIANLPDTALKGHMLGLVAVKTVILYYSYEVLVGELRKRTINFSISLVILIMGVKGVVTVL